MVPLLPYVLVAIISLGDGNFAAIHTLQAYSNINDCIAAAYEENQTSRDRMYSCFFQDDAKALTAALTPRKGKR